MKDVKQNIVISSKQSVRKEPILPLFEDAVQAWKRYKCRAHNNYNCQENLLPVGEKSLSFLLLQEKIRGFSHCS